MSGCTVTSLRYYYYETVFEEDEESTTCQLSKREQLNFLPSEATPDHLNHPGLESPVCTKHRLPLSLLTGGCKQYVARAPQHPTTSSNVKSKKKLRLKGSHLLLPDYRGLLSARAHENFKEYAGTVSRNLHEITDEGK